MSVGWSHVIYSTPPLYPSQHRYRFRLGEILEKVGMHGLDKNIIAVRAKEAEKEEARERHENDYVGDKDVINESENMHIDEMTRT
jgi:hypothetical protein